MVFGLSGFWLPLLLLGMRGEPIAPALDSLVQSGSLASFSVVLLAEGIAAVLITVGAGANPAAAGLRALAGCVGFVLVLIQVGVLAAAHVAPGPKQVSPSFHAVLTIFSIILACYLYCFRQTDWERGVDAVTEEEDEDVSRLGTSAAAQSADDKGVKL